MPRLPRPLALLFALAAALLSQAALLPEAAAQGVMADTPMRPVTRTVAVTNARVVVAPGRVLERATVVVRDGRIEAVGPRVAVPPDADVIAGDSLWVYAGFVDAFAYAGVPRPPESPNEPFRGDPGAPPPDRAGLTPELDVRTLLAYDEAAFKALRDLGFAAAHVAPRTGALAGQGAVVLLRAPARAADGRLETARDLALAGPGTLVAQMQTARGVYPGTPMGVLAVFRERVENARRYRAAGAAFARDPARAERPRFDPALEAFGPTLDGNRPLVFRADGYADGFRVLRATEDAGLPVILAGVADATPLVARLRARRAAVFAPLTLPDTVAADSAARAVVIPPAPSAGGVSFISPRRTTSYRDLPAETAALTAQRREAVRRAEAAPAALAAAGVPFAFATLEARPADVRRNLRRMIAAGLSPEAALGALTTEPARLLGLERQLGTVEAGKVGNLVLTTGDYFAENTRVRYVLVEGVRYAAESAAASRPDRNGDGRTGAAAPDVTGVWDFVVQTPIGEQRGTFTIGGRPGALTGSSEFGGQTLRFDAVEFDGTTLTLRAQGRATSGTVSGDTFTGSADLGPAGVFPLTATRRPG
ncbi:MAG: amidohydrolase family protein [Rubricoccaceae bacterium]